MPTRSNRCSTYGKQMHAIFEYSLFAMLLVLVRKVALIPGPPGASFALAQSTFLVFTRHPRPSQT